MAKIDINKSKRDITKPKVAGETKPKSSKTKFKPFSVSTPTQRDLNPIITGSRGGITATHGSSTTVLPGGPRLWIYGFLLPD